MEGSVIPDCWKIAEGVMVSKEKDASRISQFMTKSLLSVEGKIFFAVLEKYDQQWIYCHFSYKGVSSQISMSVKYISAIINIADPGSENKPWRSNIGLARPGKCV